MIPIIDPDARILDPGAMIGTSESSTRGR